jgi:hypothetical protein
LLNDGFGYSATLAASSAYSGPTAALADLIAAMNTAAGVAGSAKTYTGSIASGEQGTGYVTISISSGTFSLTWTTTTLRDYLGWVGNLSAAGSYVSPSGCLGMFLPNCPIMQPFALGDTGNKEGGISQTISPGGVTKTIKTTGRTRHPGITWSHITLARARQASESGGVRSWERFVRDCLRGDTSLAYFTPGADVKLFWDADSATAQVYHPVVPNAVTDCMEPAMGDGFVGLWRCRWPGGWT